MRGGEGVRSVFDCKTKLVMTTSGYLRPLAFTRIRSGKWPKFQLQFRAQFLQLAEAVLPASPFFEWPPGGYPISCADRIELASVLYFRRHTDCRLCEWPVPGFVRDL